jgi:hypothetical protein
MNTATKGQQAYSRMLVRLGAIDLAQDVITGAAPLSDKLYGTSGYHVTTAYWWSIITNGKVARP